MRKETQNDVWEIPSRIYDYFDEKYDFTLDAAASEENAKAMLHFTKETDGLAQEWFGNVWVFPPYRRKTQTDFVQKAIDETYLGNADLVAVLLPASTETLLFHELIVPYANHVYFIKHRLHFIGVDGKLNVATHPSMLVVFEKERKPLIMHALDDVPRR